MTQVKATAKYVRMSPRKVRLVLPVVRGQNPEIALQTLRLMPQAASGPVAKVVKSATANAENNHSLDPSRLVIVQATADEGPTMKRYAPRARGRAGAIHRRTTHVTIIVEDALPEAQKTSITQRLTKAVPKRKRVTSDADSQKDDAGSDAPATTDEKPQTSSEAAKATTKTASQKTSSPSTTKVTPESAKAGAEASPRRTTQQTGRGATTRASKPSSSPKAKDKS